MVNDVVSVGDKLELKSINSSTKKKENERVYKSQVLDFISEDTVSILMPIEGGRVIPLAVGDKYGLCFFTKKGLFQCKSIIIDRGRIDKVYVLTVQITSELEKFQRRQYYRLEYLLVFKYRLITDAEISINKKLQSNNIASEEEKQSFINSLEALKEDWLSGTILDISGGGARFVSESSLEHGNMLKISLDISHGADDKNIEIYAFVISSEKMINRIGFYEHRIQFKDIPKDVREAIIKFIFEEERRLRKREKN